MDWYVDETGIIFSAEITTESLVCGQNLIGFNDIVFLRKNWVFNIEGTSEAGSKTYKAIKWGTDTADIPDMIQDAVGDGTPYLWQTKQKYIFCANGTITAGGTDTYGGTIPTEILNDRIIEGVNVKGLNNFQYACGDVILYTDDAFLVYDKSEKTLWTWGYHHISDAHPGGVYPGKILTGITSGYSFTGSSTNKNHYFLAK